ncbi:DNA polymerase IV [Paenibacillus sp. IB182496]|uniref:DNA polymerase IV n=1 Tax=Paenibacillus sabuli TaxID=2772509 RepID=A0A927BSN9_9BACL|nr:DNA polymerase IV [Paenibacillus sabuli]MBD2846058.1 DNA polymerase IV [Paenibacillus sabuli]
MSNPHSRSPAKGRIVLHLDMNAFYCSVHEAEEPQLYRDQPTAVAGSVEQRRGIIVTSSYAARKFGVRTGMTVREGMQKCPRLVLIKPDFELYRAYSRQFMEIARQYTPLVEPVSIDECYLDITGSGAFGEPMEIAEQLQRRIREECGLPCSIGVAPNKLLAKMASDMHKPSGLTVLRRRDVPRLLWHRPCQELFGIGGKTAAKLERMNIRTIGALAVAEERTLTRAFGVNGAWLRQAANGIDHSPVSAARERSKSVGHTTTLPRDLTAPEDIARVLLNLADQTCRRLRRQGLVAATVVLTIRTPDMKTITRSHTLSAPTDSSADVYHEAQRLYARHWPDHRPVRLLGITLQNVSEAAKAPIQLDLFEYEEAPRKQALTEVMDRLRDKYGESAVLTAGMLGDDPSTLIRNRRIRGTSLQLDEHLLYIEE